MTHTLHYQTPLSYNRSRVVNKAIINQVLKRFRVGFDQLDGCFVQTIRASIKTVTSPRVPQLTLVFGVPDSEDNDFQ